MTELEVANKKEKEAKHLQDAKKVREDRGEEDSGTETEGGGKQSEGLSTASNSEGLLRPDDTQGVLRKRRSLEEASSGDLSTDSEWDKVEEAGDMNK